MTDLNKNSERQATSPPSSGFIIAALLISLMIFVLLIAQYLYHLGLTHKIPIWAGIGAAVGLTGVYIFSFSKPLLRSLATPFFATLSLLFIAGGTALGTFVTQNTLPEVFTERYGEVGSSVLRILQLHDVFHSWWYIGLFVLLSASLIKISLNRKFTKENIGFHLAHLSPVLILLGFWVDYFYGFRGIIKLEKGNSSDIVQLYQGNTGYHKDSIQLNFKIQLDHFEFENHAPDYRLQLWRAGAEQMNSHGMPTATPVDQAPPEIIASFPLEEKRTRQIYDTDIKFWMLEFYPNFTFQYTYPEVTDTIPPVNPGILFNVKTPLGEGVLQLRSNEANRNKFIDPNIGWLEYHWILPENALETSDEEIQGHSGWGSSSKVVFAGKENKIYFVSDQGVTSVPLEKNKFYSLSDKLEQGFTVLHSFPDPAYLSAVPISKNDELENPVAKVQIWSESWPKYEEAYLYPSKTRRGGMFMIPNTDYFLALESFKDMEAKFFKSDLSVLGTDDQMVKHQEIQVNKPMFYKGHRFYQTDYDPNNPNYSGIGVSFHPGLNIIYVGFFLLTLGILWMFYWASKKRSLIS